MKYLLLLLLLVGFQLQAIAQVAGKTPQCPVVTVSCPDMGVSPITFSASVTGADQTKTLTYKWTVSSGTIASGDGTSSITVDVSGLEGSSFTAAVDVTGLPGYCSSAASCTTNTCGLRSGRKVDEYGALNQADEKARLDQFAVELKKEPTAQGYILSYAGRRARAGEAQMRGDKAKTHLVKGRGFDERKIVVIDAGHREELAIELYIVRSGEMPPLATPTVEPDEVEIEQVRAGRRSRHVRP